MSERWAIILHGGARKIEPEDAQDNRRGCMAALEIGQGILSAGGEAIDAVEAVVRQLEADATFNAGYGAVLNAEGVAQLDAAIMSGTDLAVGAVAALEGVRHPVSVARRMLAETDGLLVAGGAHAFAARHGLLDKTGDVPRSLSRASGDTVGCVVLDRSGHMAVGLSTGGLSGKSPGRVGDTPLPGCGFYVDDQVGGVALSGDGEAITRTLLAARVMAALERGPPQDAVARALAHLDRIGGEAGVIALDPRGWMGWAHTSPHFALGLATYQLAPRVALHQSELKDLLHA